MLLLKLSNESEVVDKLGKERHISIQTIIKNLDLKRKTGKQKNVIKSEMLNNTNSLKGEDDMLSWFWVLCNKKVTPLSEWASEGQTLS